MNQQEKDAIVAKERADVAAAQAGVDAAVAELQKQQAELEAAIAIIVDRTPMLHKQPIYNGAMVLLRDDIQGPDRYHRFRSFIEWTKSGDVEEFYSYNQRTGGTHNALAAPAYTLQYRPIDRATGTLGAPLELARATVAPGSIVGKFTVNLAGVPDGVGIVQIQPVNPPAMYNETFPIEQLAINVNGGARDFPWFVESTDSWEWQSGTPQQWYTVKSVALDTPQARPAPLDTSDWAPFGQAIVHGGEAAPITAKLHRFNFNPPGFMYLPRRSLSGITSASGTQPYFMPGMMLYQPELPLIDGERGVARTSHTLDAFFGRHHKAYFMSPYSARVVDTTGRMRTLCGFVHTDAPAVTDVAAHTKQGKLHPYVRIVGQWPAEIPLAQRKPRNCWGWFFTKDSTGQGTGTQTVIDRTMHVAEVPHDAPVVSYVLNGHGGRILRLIHNARDHTVEPIVEVAAVTGGEVISQTGYMHAAENCTDEFDLEDLEDGTYAVSERTMNRISRWKRNGIGKADTFVEYLVQERRISTNAHYYFGAMGSTYSRDMARTLKCANPEGLDYQDGWLYFGSSVAGEVRRVNVATKEVQRVCPERSQQEGQCMAHQISVSDGTAYPRGTVGVVTFDNQTSGPRFHLPRAGKDRLGTAYTHCDEVQGTNVYYPLAWSDRALFHFESPNPVAIHGVGPTLNGVYPLAIYIGQGGVIVGGTDSWISAWRMQRAGEVMPDQNRMALGRKKYLEAGYEVEWGPYGEGASGKPFPADPDMRFWLKYGCGLPIAA